MFNNVGWSYTSYDTEASSDPDKAKNNLVAQNIIVAFLNPIFATAAITSMGVMLTYIVQIRARLATLVDENLNLLNRMHEGLVMLSRKDRKLFFASTPAITLLNQLPGMDSPYEGCIKDSTVENGIKNVSVTEETF